MNSDQVDVIVKQTDLLAKPVRFSLAQKSTNLLLLTRRTQYRDLGSYTYLGMF